MFNKINNIFDIKTIEEDLEIKEPLFKKMRSLTGLLLLLTFLLPFVIIYITNISNNSKNIEVYLHNSQLNKTKLVEHYEQPTFSNEKIQTYVSKILIDMFDSNFLEIEKKFPTYEKYFAPFAWEQFKYIAQDSFVNLMIEKSLFSKLILTEEPIILGNLEFLNGERKWKVYATGFLKYKGSIKSKRDLYTKIDIILTLKTVNYNKNPNGLLIDNFSITSGSKY